MSKAKTNNAKEILIKLYEISIFLEKQKYKNINRTLLSLKQLLLEEMPKKKEHICLLSSKDLKLTGKLIECRTVKDWENFGFNNAVDEFKDMIERIFNLR